MPTRMNGKVVSPPGYLVARAKILFFTILLTGKTKGFNTQLTYPPKWLQYEESYLKNPTTTKM